MLEKEELLTVIELKDSILKEVLREYARLQSENNRLKLANALKQWKPQRKNKAKQKPVTESKPRGRPSALPANLSAIFPLIIDGIKAENGIKTDKEAIQHLHQNLPGITKRRLDSRELNKRQILLSRARKKLRHSISD